MFRKKNGTFTPPPAAPSQPAAEEAPPPRRKHSSLAPAVHHVIEPNAIYTRRALLRALLLAEESVRQAERRGELRYSVRARRRWYKGEWILQWLEGGERKRSPAEVRS